ncbi:MAG: CHAD domain-containing protein [Thermostichus sp. DG_1_5_bins_95]
MASEAHCLLKRQWQRLQKHVARVLGHHEEAVESLHQIRVTLRRMSTWVQVFQGSVKLPKPFKRIQKLASALGQQRDLDVLLEILQEPCWEGIRPTQQVEWQQLRANLSRRRAKAEDRSHQILQDPAFLKLQAACEEWLAHPRYTPQAQLPLQESLPHLLTPLLAKWLLQPGWRIPSVPHTRSETKQLHELRKAGKQLRYQLEFFADCYGKGVQEWLQALRTLQDQLGRFHDLQVLQEYLDPDSNLKEVLQAQQALTLQDWPLLRLQYLSPQQQQQLYQMLLTPLSAETAQPATQ